VGGKEVAIDPPTEHHLELKNGRLTLFFTVPVATPVMAKGQQLTVSVFDPTYFVGFEFGPEATAELVGAPATCISTSRVPQTLDARTMARLSTLPIDQTELPPDLRAAAALLSTQFIINCK
jgi:tRNA threonylcarbamoyladenosine biosynthesis protein TsaE